MLGNIKRIGLGIGKYMYKSALVATLKEFLKEF